MQTASSTHKRDKPTTDSKGGSAGVLPARRSGICTIEPEALFRCLASGQRVLVIDVRETAEIERSRTRFPGAIHVPVHQLFVRRNELPLGKVAMVVAVSNDGTRSHAAALTLSLLGFTDVRSLEGGLEAWARKGLPLA